MRQPYSSIRLVESSEHKLCGVCLEGWDDPDGRDTRVVDGLVCCGEPAAVEVNWFGTIEHYCYDCWQGQLESGEDSIDDLRRETSP